jgi:IS30 family transposase
VLLAKMEDATAASSFGSLLCETKFDCRALTAQLHFTYAQGKEMSRHQALDAACGVKVYFCELHLAVATRHLQKR